MQDHINQQLVENIQNTQKYSQEATEGLQSVDAKIERMEQKLDQ